MNYSKPEVSTLGQAKIVIEGTVRPKITHGTFDGGQAPLSYVAPAYDLDD
jgi:hypothetical protein